MSARVAVTGVGLVSCLGHSYETVIDRISRGESGVRSVERWVELGLKSTIGGTIEDVEEKKGAARIPKKIVPGMSDAALYCSIAARDAVAAAGLEAADLQRSETGCIVGSGTVSVETIFNEGNAFFAGKTRGNPFSVIRSMASCCSAAVASLLKIHGPSYSISSACATSAHNIGHAFQLVRAGVLDLAVAGGGEDIHELIAVSFQNLRMALSTRYNDRPAAASRPYDAGRDGFVLGGGGGIVVLENLERARARGARVMAEIVGYAATSDGYDMVLPEPEGTHAAECMRLALADGDITPGEIDYVNTHGTSTGPGDVIEVKAMGEVFGERLPRFSSTKSMTGHGLGAAGALELIFCVGMMDKGFLAPSINIETCDPVLDGAPVVTATVHERPATVLTNNFGFGGTNAAIVLRQPDE